LQQRLPDSQHRYEYRLHLLAYVLLLVTSPLSAYNANASSKTEALNIPCPLDVLHPNQQALSKLSEHEESEEEDLSLASATGLFINLLDIDLQALEEEVILANNTNKDKKDISEQSEHVTKPVQKTIPNRMMDQGQMI
jgi:hypothetical protein